jgi:hypothetical protein
MAASLSRGRQRAERTRGADAVRFDLLLVFGPGAAFSMVSMRRRSTAAPKVTVIALWLAKNYKYAEF